MKKSDLKRVLGKWSLTAIGIGAIIGGGIFVLTGKVAHYNAGPALALSFVVAGIACIFAALCYAEFASMLPVEGSAYAYAYGTVGEIFAWLIGWGLILEYGMGAMTVAVSWSGYFNKLLGLFGLKIPAEFANAPFDQNPGYMNVPAFLITWVVTSILVKGIKEAASANNIIVILKVSAILFVIFVGMFFIKVSNWSPFIPEPELIKGEDGNMHQAYGVQGIFAGAASIFFAYIGFDAVSTQAGEAINPKKDMPFAIIASLLICTVLYIAVALVLTGMMNYKEFTGEDLKAPVAAAFQKNGIDWAMYHHGGGYGRTYFGDACNDARTNAYLLRYGKRWSVTRFLQSYSSYFQNSLQKYFTGGFGSFFGGGFCSAYRAWRYDQLRNTLCLCYGLWSSVATKSKRTQCRTPI